MSRIWATIVRCDDAEFVSSGQLVKVALNQSDDALVMSQVDASDLHSLANIVQWYVSDSPDFDGPPTGPTGEVPPSLEPLAYRIDVLGRLGRWEKGLVDGPGFNRMSSLFALFEILTPDVVIAAVRAFGETAPYQGRVEDVKVAQLHSAAVAQLISRLTQKLEKGEEAFRVKAAIRGRYDRDISLPADGAPIPTENLWINVFGMLQQSWATICAQGNNGVIVCYFLDNGSVSGGQAFPTQDFAEKVLRGKGYFKFEAAEAPVIAPPRVYRRMP